MRRQYHSRNSKRGLLVWDIHRLIELSGNVPLSYVSTERLLEQERLYWFDPDNPLTAMDIAIHAKLIQDTDLKYPIILCAEGRLMDGMHRLCKAWLTQQSQLAAVQFAQTPEPDHIGVSLEDLPYDEPW